MNAIGVIVPGQPCLFAEKVEGQLQWLLQLDAAAAAAAADFVCFLTPNNEPLPPDSGLGIYFSRAPFENWEFLGVLTNNRPSTLISTGWNFLPESEHANGIRLGFLVESAQSLMEKLETKPIVDVKKEYARKVALNLYRFVESFQGGGDQTLLDRWFERFEAKYKIDPNFVMKSE